MHPRDLRPEQFNHYPPLARKLVTDHLDALRRVPLSFLPSLLREVVQYDYKFPAERDALDKEMANLSALSGQQIGEWFRAFEKILLSPQLEHFDWVNAPADFVEQLSAYLWTTHQVDMFRQAALDYAARLQAAVPPERPAVPRLGIAVIGHGVATRPFPLFRKLRPHGVCFSRVNPESGLSMLLDAVAARARSHPVAFGHWYIEGGNEVAHDPTLTCVSYASLEPARAALLRRMRSAIQSAGMGPEALRTILAQMRPADVGWASDDTVWSRFQLSLLTEGSGTQVFSTTFVQWTVREALRRAQPLTVLARFAPRQRQKPMNELLSRTDARAELDPPGSLIDADMGAYYNWLNQQRLPGAERSSFLAWFEGKQEALVIAPSMPRGTESSTPATLRDLLAWMA